MYSEVVQEAMQENGREQLQEPQIKILALRVSFIVKILVIAGLKESF